VIRALEVREEFYARLSAQSSMNADPDVSRLATIYARLQRGGRLLNF
jgi:hypothetical protein